MGLRGKCSINRGLQQGEQNDQALCELPPIYRKPYSYARTLFFISINAFPERINP